ncbi:MAG: DNA repair protein RecO [Clostridia bacterium]|nr:DNA repair protein RecO [Clostridia bacterium]
MLETTKGIVIREVAVGEKDKLLTVLTHDLGVITVSAKGIRSVKNPNISSAQLFCYSNFVLYKKGDFYWLRESDLIESFYGLRSDIEKYALAAYICSIAEDFACVEEDTPIVERLVLNTLYSIANELAERKLIKASFEMRVAAVFGFMPDLFECSSCMGELNGRTVFDVMNGGVMCEKCRQRSAAAVYLIRDDSPDSYESLEPVIRFEITSDVLAALRYVVTAKGERLFSFKLEESSLDLFSEICEKYLLHHLGRGFATLDFYKSMIE